MQEAKKLKHKADALVRFQGFFVLFHSGTGYYKNVSSESHLKPQKPRGTLLLTEVCFRLNSINKLFATI